MKTAELQRDESGRLLADDGYPVGGMATVRDAVAVSKLSKSMVYQMLDSGELECRRYGRSVRIPWTSIRATFLDCE